ncbi:MAG: ABC transporter ATP-binding protein [Candidatus Bipolaricaulota bacterium]|nr:ABC transporter ATP-binding protein [Candidatus Bipolaricaulota bacterium]
MNKKGRKSSGTNPVLDVRDLVVSYTTRSGNVTAVRGVDLSVEKGKTQGIVGESGCGKSTLAFAIMGYLDRNGQIESGQILLDGEDISNKSQDWMRQIWGKELNIVYQDPSAALNPSMKIGKQIGEVLETHGKVPEDKSREETIDMLRELQISDPDIVVDSYPHQLSGGMRQRVCLAMALISRPKLLIMDEPTTNLDVTVEAKILDIIKDLKDEFDTTIVYITHDLGVVYEVSDRSGVMYAGRFVEEGPTDELIGNPIHPYTRGLLRSVPEVSSETKKGKLRPIRGSVVELDNLPSGCKFNPRCPYKQEGCTGKEPEFETVGGDRYVRCLETEKVLADTTEKGSEPDEGEFRCEGKSSRDKILNADKVKKYFGEVTTNFFTREKEDERVRAVDDVSFDLDEGNTLGVVGESGCGKSTLARTIIGLEDITDGQIKLEDRDISVPIEGRDQEILRRIRIVFQDPRATLNPKRTIKQAMMRPIKLAGANHEEALRRTEELLQAVDLGASFMDRHPDQLSGGQKQRVAIARAFASQPELILCDEPTSSLDVSIQSSIINLLLDLQDDLNTSFMYISHNLSVVSYISDYMAVMYLGRLVEVGPTGDILNPPYHPYTEALLSSVSMPNPDVEQKRIRLSGAVPSARNVPSGCRFHTRCPRKVGEICEAEEPPTRADRSEEHTVTCHIPVEELREVEPVLQK